MKPLKSKTGRILLVLVLLGCGLRLGYLLHATSLPRYAWDDPDHYAVKGRELAGEGRGWRWNFDVIRHSSYDHRVYALPPAYPAFLSIFALFPGYPFSAQVAQALASTLSILLLFAIGRAIHSERAGLIAAAIYAVWVPNVIAVWSTMQESIYVPLVLLATFLLLRAVEGGDKAWWRFALAGAATGLAALARSMPIYVVPIVVGILLLQRRSRALGAAAALMAGFFALTLPYSVALSRELGRPTFIENHGSIFIVERFGGVEGNDPPTLTQTASILVRGIASAPSESLDEWRFATRSVLHVNGGRLLQIYLGTATRSGAWFAKLATHIAADISFVACLLLAPFGFALCRRRDLAVHALVWIGVTFGLTALSGFGGPRLRMPFEPHLVVLAAVVLAGGYRTSRPLVLGIAAAISLALATVVLPQLPASFAARGDYGVHWPLKAPPKRSPMMGHAGFSVLTVDGSVRFTVRPRNPDGRTIVRVKLDGIAAEEMTLARQEHRFELAASHEGLSYVEVSAEDARSGEPVRLYVIVPKRS